MSRHSSKVRPLVPRSKQPRKWQMVVVVAVVAFLVVGMFYAAWMPPQATRPSPPSHEHLPSPHGGVMVSLDEGDRHFHVEAVLQKGGILRLYTLNEDLTRVMEVNRQVLIVSAKPVGGGEQSALTLIPSPQPGDSLEHTSQFVGGLPDDLRGQDLLVVIPALRVDGRDYPVQFTTRGHGHDDAAVEDEQKLFLTPGGKYTESDIKKNGGATASMRYRGFQSKHDLNPRKGERVCPVTLTRVNPKCSWVIADQQYLFCCPPCIGEFIRVAKLKPEEVREAESYVKK